MTASHFNSLAPCGANPKNSHRKIHTRTFQLTRPVWGEPRQPLKGLWTERISTHSPRVGRTARPPICAMIRANFNSLAPCGANHDDLACFSDQRTFQLTRPVWGEPPHKLLYSKFSRISTHSPRVGRTLRRYGRYKDRTHFNSLAPCGANPNRFAVCISSSRFQLTRPVWGEPS